METSWRWPPGKSFGLTSTSCFEGAACTAEALVSAADEALYEAKGAGRDCVRLAA